jgi:hypothetical protein
MATGKRLPVPQRMSPTQRAKIKDEDLPVGGAPPIKDLPRFDKMPPPRPMPENVEKAQLPQARQARSPEEIKSDFQKLAEMTQQQQQPTPPQEAKSPPPPKEEPAPEEDDSGPTLGDLNDFGWGAYHDNLQDESDYRKPEVREAIESRCAEIEIGDLILYESVNQRHIIIPGQLEVVFRSITASEDLAIKDVIYRTVGSQRYILDTLTLMTLCCGLKTFNDAELPDHMEMKDGERFFNESRFNEKMKVLKGLSLPVVSLLSVAYIWFDQRIRRQLVMGVLGK